MLSISDLRRGMTIEMDGQVYLLVEYQHVKMQQRAPVLRLKLKDMKSGKTIEKTVPASQKLTPARVDNRTVQFLYSDGQLYTFMDTETFDQTQLDKAALGGDVLYLKEAMEVQLTSYKGQFMGIALPITVDLKVTEAAPGFKGDTAQSGTKSARVETGLSVHVPLFINAGDTIRIDTRTGLYVERVS